MKKFSLPIVVVFLSFLTTVFLLPQEVNAQKTDPECFREYQNKEYKCLQKFNDCTKPCTSLGSVEAYKPCANKCSAQDKTCSDQASTDLTACKAAIPKNNEEIASEDKSAQDCRKMFDKESYKCLGVSGDCQRKCGEETKRPDGGAYFNSGEVYSKCTKASDCDGKGRACNEQALANFRACLDSDKQPETAKTSKQESNWLEFLGINPYQTWLRLQELVEVAEFYATGNLEESLEGGFLNLWGRKSIRQKDEEAIAAKEKTFESIFGKDWKQQLSQPRLDAKAETDAWSVPAPKGELLIDIPETIDTKRYSWDENSGVVVKSNDWERIMFREPVEVGGLTTHTLELGEGAIEVKVRNNNPVENQFGVDAGWLGVTVSRTHFYVSKDPNGKFAIVSVYEGEVEVKTRDGDTIKVRPDGNKPGIVVVSRIISPVKLAVVGLVLVVITGGIVFLLRKKNSPQKLLQFSR